MASTVALPGLTALLALAFSLAVVDQWRTRRRPYQAIWALGTVFYAVAAGCEALAGAGGWNEPLYRLWYLSGAVLTAGWLGLGNAFLLARTRFGYAFALGLFLAGLFTFLTVRRSPELYADAGLVPLAYALAGAVIALAVAIETYFQNERWPWLAAAGVVGASLLGAADALLLPLRGPATSAIDPATGMPTGAAAPTVLRLLTPFLNVTGALALILGALFSTYVFMPKRRLLPYSLDPTQPGDVFLFNLAIAPVAMTVNFVASLPGAAVALLRGRLHSRVPATLLIALGAFVPTVTDSLNRFGVTGGYQVGKLVGVVLLFAGFLVSTEVFRQFRIPFTGIRLGGVRREPADGDGGDAGL